MSSDGVAWWGAITGTLGTIIGVSALVGEILRHRSAILPSMKVTLDLHADNEGAQIGARILNTGAGRLYVHAVQLVPHGGERGSRGHVWVAGSPVDDAKMPLEMAPGSRETLWVDARRCFGFKTEAVKWEVERSDGKCFYSDPVPIKDVTEFPLKLFCLARGLKLALEAQEAADDRDAEGKQSDRDAPDGAPLPEDEE